MDLADEDPQLMDEEDGYASEDYDFSAPFNGNKAAADELHMNAENDLMPRQFKDLNVS